MNLYWETLDAIGRARKRDTDVTWVGSADGAYRLSWVVAGPLLEIHYDCDTESQAIASDLVVVFVDGSWLERWWANGSAGGGTSARPRPRRRFAPDPGRAAARQALRETKVTAS